MPQPHSLDNISPHDDAPLTAIVHGRKVEDSPKHIDALRFRWRRLYSLKQVLAFHTAHGDQHEDVQIVHGDRMDFGYGSRFLGSRECWLYPDGYALLGCTVSEWQGTFGPENKAVMEFFELTPMNKIDADRSVTMHSSPTGLGRRDERMSIDN